MMLFQLVEVLLFTAVQVLAMVFFTTPMAEVTVERIEEQVEVTVLCICFHIEPVVPLEPLHAVDMFLLISALTLLTADFIEERVALTADWMPVPEDRITVVIPITAVCTAVRIAVQLVVVAVCTCVQSVRTAVATCVPAVVVLVAICVQALV